MSISIVAPSYGPAPSNDPPPPFDGNGPAPSNSALSLPTPSAPSLSSSQDALPPPPSSLYDVVLPFNPPPYVAPASASAASSASAVSSSEKESDLKKVSAIQINNVSKKPLEEVASFTKLFEEIVLFKSQLAFQSNVLSVRLTHHKPESLFPLMDQDRKRYDELLMQVRAKVTALSSRIELLHKSIETDTPNYQLAEARWSIGKSNSKTVGIDEKLKDIVSILKERQQPRTTSSGLWGMVGRLWGSKPEEAPQEAVNLCNRDLASLSPVDSNTLQIQEHLGNLMTLRDEIEVEHSLALNDRVRGLQLCRKAIPAFKEAQNKYDWLGRFYGQALRIVNASYFTPGPVEDVRYRREEAETVVDSWRLLMSTSVEIRALLEAVQKKHSITEGCLKEQAVSDIAENDKETQNILMKVTKLWCRLKTDMRYKDADVHATYLAQYQRDYDDTTRGLADAKARNDAYVNRLKHQCEAYCEEMKILEKLSSTLQSELKQAEDTLNTREANLKNNSAASIK